MIQQISFTEQQMFHQSPRISPDKVIVPPKKAASKFNPISPPEDKTWPLFRLDKELLTKFWDKKTAKDMNKVWFDQAQLPSQPLDLFFSGNMLRIGKKKKTVKGYYFRLSTDGTLMYFKKENDSAPKGYLHLNLHMRASIIKQKTKKSNDLPVVYIERCQGVGITIFNHYREKTMNLFESVKQFCLMRGYEYIYAQTDLLGQGSFASVYKVQNQFTAKFYAAKTYFQETYSVNQHKDKFQVFVFVSL